jgi:excisionase family DNA binding protein
MVVTSQPRCHPTDMDLTLPEVAARLKLPERQIRYMIKTGRLPARKVADRWLIAETDLPGGGPHPARQAAAAR